MNKRRWKKKKTKEAWGLLLSIIVMLFPSFSLLYHLSLGLQTYKGFSVSSFLFFFFPVFALKTIQMSSVSWRLKHVNRTCLHGLRNLTCPNFSMNRLSEAKTWCLDEFCSGHSNFCLSWVIGARNEFLFYGSETPGFAS